MPRKSKNSPYAPSGPRIDPLMNLAQQQHLPFTLSVVKAILERNTSLQPIADALGIHRDTLIRFLHTRMEDDTSVRRVLKIAEMLDLDPVQSLNEFFFDGEHIERAFQFYVSFNMHFLEATIPERAQAFLVVDRFLSLSQKDRAIFLSMLDTFQGHSDEEMVTPVQQNVFPLGDSFQMLTEVSRQIVTQVSEQIATQSMKQLELMADQAIKQLEVNRQVLTDHIFQQISTEVTRQINMENGQLIGRKASEQIATQIVERLALDMEPFAHRVSQQISTQIIGEVSDRNSEFMEQVRNVDMSATYQQLKAIYHPKQWRQYLAREAKRRGSLKQVAKDAHTSTEPIRRGIREIERGDLYQPTVPQIQATPQEESGLPDTPSEE